jgi:hypothetical protein
MSKPDFWIIMLLNALLLSVCVVYWYLVWTA